MSSVTIGRDLRWKWADPDSEAGSPARTRRRFAARTSGEVVAGVDLVALAVAVVVFAPKMVDWTVAVFVVGVLAICALRGQYASRITFSVSKDVGTVAAAVGVPLALIGVLDGFGREIRSVVLVGLGTLSLLLVGRVCAYAGIRRARTRGALGQRVLIVGAGPVAERFADAIELNPAYGLHPVGLLDDCEDESLSRPVLGGIDQLDDVLREHRIDRVVIAFGVNRDPDLVRVIRSCENAAVDMYIVPRFFELGLPRRAVRRRHGVGLPAGAAAPVDHATLGTRDEAGLRRDCRGRHAVSLRPPLRAARPDGEADQPGAGLLPPAPHRKERTRGRDLEVPLHAGEQRVRHPVERRRRTRA